MVDWRRQLNEGMFQRSTVEDNQPRELAGMVLMEEQRIIIIMCQSLTSYIICGLITAQGVSWNGVDGGAAHNNNNVSKFDLIYNLWINKVIEYTQANVTLISIVGSVVRYSITIKSLIPIYNGGIPGDVGFKSILQRGCQQKK